MAQETGELPKSTPALAKWLVEWWFDHPRVSAEPAPLWPESVRERVGKLDPKGAKAFFSACEGAIRAMGDAPGSSRLTAQLAVLSFAFKTRGVQVSRSRRG